MFKKRKVLPLNIVQKNTEPIKEKMLVRAHFGHFRQFTIILPPLEEEEKWKIKIFLISGHFGQCLGVTKF